MAVPLPITTRPIRFALVGCGRISANHFEALRLHGERAHLVAVCDNQPAALAAAVATTGAAGFDSLDALLQGSDADIVTLATPSGLHPRQAMQVAAAGRHVLTEKPMATKWDDGMAMVRACRDAGVKLFVVKQNRLNPTMQLLKAAVDGGRFGRVYMVNVNVFWTRPQSYYDDAPWRGRWDMDGGAFLNQASHYVDMVDWLVGPVDSVHAYTATLARAIEAVVLAGTSVNLRGAPSETSKRELEESGVSEVDADEIATLMRACEDARFSPDGVHGETAKDTWERAKKVLDRVEGKAS